MNKQMLKSTLQVGFATVVAKGLVCIKDIFLASRYGATQELDLFIYSFTLIMLIVNFLGNPLQLLLTTTLARLDATGRSNERQSLVSSTVTFVIVACLVCSTIIFFWAQSQNHLIYKALAILIVFGVFATLNLILQAALDSRRDFLIGSLAQASVALVTIITVWLLPNVNGLTLLASAAVVGALIEFVIIYIRANLHQLKLVPSFYRPPAAFMTMLKQSAIYLVGSFFSSFIDVIDQSMALLLGVGSVTAWSYGAKIPLFLNLVIGMALARVLLPEMSKSFGTKDTKGANKALFRSVILAVVLSSVSVLILYYYTPLIVSFLFERGLMSSEAILAIANVQKIYLLSVIPYSCSLLFARALLALQCTGFIAIAAIINLLIKIVFNIYFIDRFGVVGLSYSTVVMCSMSLVMLCCGYIYFSRQNLDNSKKYDR